MIEGVEQCDRDYDITPVMCAVHVEQVNNLLLVFQILHSISI